jgi:prolyl-tRNA synthetase
MRFSELKIQTQREAPANARTEGFAFLIRAAYLSREGEPTRLGEQALTRLHALAASAGGDFFARLGLPFIGGENVFFPFASGPTDVIHCPACGYAARKELAAFKKTALPAEAPLPLEKVLTPDCHTIEALANFLGLPEQKTAKALMFTRISDGKFIFAVVRGDMALSEAKLRGLVGDFRLATASEIIQAGCEPGYASPIGLKDTLIVVDDLVPQSANLAAGANEAGYHLVNTNYGRDYSAAHVADLTLAEAGAACPHCGQPLGLERAISLKEGQEYHYTSILAALAEIHHDEKGLAFPPAAAPFDVYLMQVPGKTMDTAAEASKLYTALQSAGLAVLFDDREERAGVKFNDADLIGPPVRVTAGERALQNGMVELKPRLAAESLNCPLDDVPAQVRALLT